MCRAIDVLAVTGCMGGLIAARYRAGTLGRMSRQKRIALAARDLGMRLSRRRLSRMRFCPMRGNLLLHLLMRKRLREVWSGRMHRL